MIIGTLNEDLNHSVEKSWKQKILSIQMHMQKCQLLNINTRLIKALDS